MILDPRIRWALRGQMWPKWWRDFSFIKASQVGERNRLEVIGLGGIGKTHFARNLKRRLGVMSPTRITSTEFSPEWSQLFNSALSQHGQRLMSPEVEWEKKVKSMRKFLGRVELEEKAFRRPNKAVVINTESLVRSRWNQIAGLAATRPEFISNLLRDRLILVCEADDPAGRSLQGRKKRGEDVTDSPHLRQKLNEQMFRIREAAIVLASLGVPVLTINLDRSISYNVPLVAKFLHENAVTSKKIRRLAKHAP